jgi:hypothetical protein
VRQRGNPYKLAPDGSFNGCVSGYFHFMKDFVS